MAKFDRLTVYQTTLSTGLVPVFYHRDLEVAKQVVAACVEGGLRVFEFTNRGDRAWNLFDDLITHCEIAHPELILGVGSVVDGATAGMYIGSGANFVVGPMLNPEIARLCNRRKIAYMPGCGSVSEISAAEELGVEIVKIFPGEQVGGPAFVKAVLGPMPWSRLMPTGGVEGSRESIESWFKAGVACVGMGSQLIPKALLQAGDYAAIRDNVRRVLALVQTVKG